MSRYRVRAATEGLCTPLLCFALLFARPNSASLESGLLLMLCLSHSYYLALYRSALFLASATSLRSFVMSLDETCNN
ncbi:uncharacterized protein BO66DRAFT_30445 [Aspergillus aculeatinus CBS 121060]|uniref:Uncharacterized protein n=1 Tax=Aspergillus aculeatinus CBS 121060 TaxID=1448322 RepID=A0ACD1HFD4_9EURO|nr:hypothetical protein BO66DRAFT_30445 [Aspergillus aculeatinus CBS 121060]RAH72279.1 hypothetical protein BO66DRAFT_30445 [Aspergillus aculeatinus CBS 121060]